LGVRFLFLSVILAACTREVAPTASRAYDTSCQNDWECVPAPTCCPVPCSEVVINAKDQARARSELRCDANQQCPVAGGCRTFAYLCVRSACKIVFSNEPDYRTRASPPDH